MLPAVLGLLVLLLQVLQILVVNPHGHCWLGPLENKHGAGLETAPLAAPRQAHTHDKEGDDDGYGHHPSSHPIGKTLSPVTACATGVPILATVSIAAFKIVRGA